MEHKRQQSVTTIRAVDRAERTLDIVASTYDVDSYGTRIDPNGWELEQFRKNPVILLSHNDREFPVAKAVVETVRVEDGKLLMRIQFPSKGVDERADKAFALYADGFMRGISVGFDPDADAIEQVEEGEGQEKRMIHIYRKARLLEVSLVTIPSNDNALAQRAANLNQDVEEVTKRTVELEATFGEPEVQPEKPSDAEIEKWRGYFEQKQPVNKESSKVLKAFFKAHNEAQPDEEVAAWLRMMEIIEEEASAPGKPTVETTTTTEEPVVAEQPAPNPPVQEAPEPERKASVQISLDALPRLGQTIRKACVEAAVEASRRGIPAKDLGEVARSAGQQFGRAILSQSL